MRERLSQTESVLLKSGPGEPGLDPESSGPRFSLALCGQHYRLELGLEEWRRVATSKKTKHLPPLSLDRGGHQPPAESWPVCPSALGFYCASMGEGRPGLLSPSAGCEF